MSKLDKLPQPTEADIRAASQDPVLADGDFCFVGYQEPTFGTQGKNPHVYQAAIKLAPLKDARDKKSTRMDLAITAWVAYPVSLDPKQTVPTKDVGDACRFFRALYGEAFPLWPIFKQKDQTQKQFEDQRTACAQAAIKCFAEMHEKPAIVKLWCVHGRRKTEKGYQRTNFYDAEYLKKMNPAWKLSEVKAG